MQENFYYSQFEKCNSTTSENPKNIWTLSKKKFRSIFFFFFFFFFIFRKIFELSQKINLGPFFFFFFFFLWFFETEVLGCSIKHLNFSMLSWKQKTILDHFPKKNFLKTEILSHFRKKILIPFRSFFVKPFFVYW